ncbi:MAG: YggU family protein [Candidatus Dadabacteria bacterium]|nr:MAG: YggU family protein [Candidatus Dadabacteria bacterium]
MASAPFLRESKGKLVLDVLVSPRSKANKIVGQHGNRLKIALKAPPADGKANKALIAYLADYFGITKKDIAIISGQSSREKSVVFSADSADKIINRLQSFQIE